MYAWAQSSKQRIVFRPAVRSKQEKSFRIGPFLYNDLTLFVPGGLFLCELLPQKWKHWQCVMITLFLLTALSIGIEALQYRYTLGCVETDDVIFNMLGAGIGTLICCVSARMAAKDEGQLFKSVRDCAGMFLKHP